MLWISVPMETFRYLSRGGVNLFEFKRLSKFFRLIFLMGDIEFSVFAT